MKLLITYILIIKISLIYANTNYIILKENIKYPWSIELLPDKTKLITSKTGILYRYKDKSLIQIENLPSNIIYKGQGGLLDIIKDFINNKRIYLSYVGENKSKKTTTIVITAELINNRLENTKKIFEAIPYMESSHHFGSRLLQIEDYLYITLGDRGVKETAQDLKTHHGSIIRIYTDGRIPKENPFIKHKKALKDIYSYGHRNIQGITYDEDKKEILAHEHGPRGGDELNIIKKGRNYGWPIVTHGINYNLTKISNFKSLKGYEDPQKIWIPSIAPSGLKLDRKDKMKKNIYIGSLKYRYLLKIGVNRDIIEEEILLKELNERVRDIEIDENGNIYVITDSENGKLIKITEK